MSDLQRYFSGLGNAPSDSEGAGSAGAAVAGAAGESTGAATAAAGAAGPRVDLAAALASPEVVSTATAPPNAARLTPHLPPAPSAGSQDDVRTTLLSPQFAQVNPKVLRTCFRLCLVGILFMTTVNAHCVALFTPFRTKFYINLTIIFVPFKYLSVWTHYYVMSGETIFLGLSARCTNALCF